jgi:predicted PurR-regulated permease PerM
MKRFIKAATKKFREMKKIREKYESQKTISEIKSSTKSATANEVLELEISTQTLLKIGFFIVLFFAAAKLFVTLQNVFVIVGISFFLAISLSPIVNALEKYKVPRPIAILCLYVLFFGAIGILFVQIIPIIAEQLQNIATDLTKYLSNGGQEIPFVSNFLETLQIDTIYVQTFIADNLSAISKNLQSIAGSTFGILSGLFSGVFNFIFSLVLIFFILLEREQLGDFFIRLVVPEKRKTIEAKIKIIQRKMVEWFKGLLILMISMGTFMYIGMKVFEIFFDMKYAATIALLAAFAELFPYIGPLITGVLAVLIAINISWLLVIIVLCWILIAQFLEGNLLVPLVMEKAVGMSSVAVMLALSIGGILGNAIGGVPMAILGMILSIPIGASISFFISEYVKRRA